MRRSYNKYIYIILILVVLIFLSVGCQQIFGETSITQTTTTATETTINPLQDEFAKLQNDYDKLEADYNKLNEENQKYYFLLDNLNELLSNVYYGYASNSNWISDGFTAFSLKYNDKYYLITAGHCVHYKYGDIDTGVYTNFKFKANLSDEWIYPELLTYKNDFLNKRDYAIFVSDKITDGFEIDKDKDIPLFVVNNISFIKDYTKKTVNGESGSPVIDIECEVTNIATTDMYGYHTKIETVLQAIDNIN